MISPSFFAAYNMNEAIVVRPDANGILFDRAGVFSEKQFADLELLEVEVGLYVVEPINHDR